MPYKTMNFRITGVSPLLMHNGQLADPMHRVSKEMRKISSKRKKTEADFEELAHLEFLGGLYLFNGEPCIPGEILEATFVNSARKNRLGEQAKAGMISDGMFPLEYDGPRKPEQLWKDDRFRLSKAVRVQRNKVIRTRPIFREWAAVISFDYLDTFLSDSDVREIVVRMGEQIGIGDWRPKFGRFRTEVAE